MELLHMKIFHLFVEPDLDFLRFPKHKTGWGLDTQARVYSPPPCIIDIPCLMLIGLIK